MPVYRPRKPSSAPSEGSLAQRDAFAATARQSLLDVRASAEAWRNGLSAFLALVTTGVIIKGRDTTAGLPTSWRLAVTLLIGGGLVCAVIGLWRVLAAQAGTRYRLSTLQELRSRYGSIETYHVAIAAEAIGKLNTGRRFVFVALLLLLSGVGVNWWAPTASPATYVQVTSANNNACGALRSGDDGQIRLATTGNQLIAIPLAQVTRLTVVNTCQ
ncbi:hypothetical protein DMH04_42835 [Kibdelosporangium aridum]|uniref:Uncharacterized protein n=1 Tax=Kibdelosporangium aridum TaxID=2030 RepID=A0A428YSP3_KIBAR|nr:hypothetical protein [Kibdelosporangium aridum]RSM72373.1 hypothetical protein DMH04_42835 [Kibdelosporangium aridum]